MPRRPKHQPPTDDASPATTPTTDETPVDPDDDETTPEDDDDPDDDAHLAAQAPLFEVIPFDPEAALHQIMKLSERARLARSLADLQKSKYTETKHAADALDGELNELIRDIAWKQKQAEQRQIQPVLEDVSDQVATESLADA